MREEYIWISKRTGMLILITSIHEDFLLFQDEIDDFMINKISYLDFNEQYEYLGML